jgi:hypothetical protein
METLERLMLDLTVARPSEVVRAHGLGGLLLLVYPFIAKRLQFYRSVTKSLWFRSDQISRTRSLIAVA